MRISKPFLAVSFAAALLAGAGGALLGVCGPFSDTANDAFCPFVLEVFYTGITTGTTATTYSPADNVTRLQMAAFLSRTVDAALKRGSRRSALRKFWTTQGEASLGLTTVDTNPTGVEFDGLDLWVAHSNTVSRVRASDGKRLETWTGALEAHYAISAMGKIFVTGFTDPGRLYQIDPSQPAGSVTTVASNLGIKPYGIAYDGARIWTANYGDGLPGTGSVSIVWPGAAIPWPRANVSLGFSIPRGALYDGNNIWITDRDLDQLLKLSSDGAILQTVTVGLVPGYPAFDGQRVLVTNNFDGSVSLWKATDLTAIGSFSTGVDTVPGGVCSNGIDFWVTLAGPDKLARF